ILLRDVARQTIERLRHRLTDRLSVAVVLDPERAAALVNAAAASPLHGRPPLRAGLPPSAASIARPICSATAAPLSSWTARRRLSCSRRRKRLTRTIPSPPAVERFAIGPPMPKYACI